MENYKIICIIAAIAVIGVIYTVKHFKGEGGLSDHLNNFPSELAGGEQQRV